MARSDRACRDMSMKAPRVSVVIPTWRRALWLDRCLRALLDQEPIPTEVIVVGRDEDPEARAVARRAAQGARLPVRWVEVSRPGHVAPVKRGLQEAQGEMVAFLDDDTEPRPPWLAVLLQPFEDPRVACVGGRVVTPGFRGVVRRNAGRVGWYGKHGANVGAREDPSPVEVDGVMEGNWVWRRNVLSRLEFDPIFDFDDAAMYGLDLCLQARHLGYRIVYEPRARVIHHGAPRDAALDRGDRPRRTHSYSRNYTYLALKHLRGVRRLAFAAWWWGVGERGSYGLAKGLADISFKRAAWSDLTVSFRGKRAGVRAWRGR